VSVKSLLAHAQNRLASSTWQIQTKPNRCLWKCAEEQQQQQELNFRHYIEQEGFFSSAGYYQIEHNKWGVFLL
jgi:hypothetical protein